MTTTTELERLVWARQEAKRNAADIDLRLSAAVAAASGSLSLRAIAELTGIPATTIRRMARAQLAAS